MNTKWISSFVVLGLLAATAADAQWRDRDWGRENPGHGHRHGYYYESNREGITQDARQVYTLSLSLSTYANAYLADSERFESEFEKRDEIAALFEVNRFVKSAEVFKLIAADRIESTFWDLPIAFERLESDFQLMRDSIRNVRDDNLEFVRSVRNTNRTIRATMDTLAIRVRGIGSRPRPRPPVVPPRPPVVSSASTPSG